MLWPPPLKSNAALGGLNLRWGNGYSSLGAAKWIWWVHQGYIGARIQSHSVVPGTPGSWNVCQSQLHFLGGTQNWAQRSKGETISMRLNISLPAGRKNEILSRHRFPRSSRTDAPPSLQNVLFIFWECVIQCLSHLSYDVNNKPTGDFYFIYFLLFYDMHGSTGWGKKSS